MYGRLFFFFWYNKHTIVVQYTTNTRFGMPCTVGRLRFEKKKKRQGQKRITESRTRFPPKLLVSLWVHTLQQHDAPIQLCLMSGAEMVVMRRRMKKRFFRY